MAGLNDKLNAIQCALVATKDAQVNFGKTRYTYRSCESILMALKPLLKEHKVVVTLSDEIKQVGDRVYIVSTATIRDGEAFVNATAWAREPSTKHGMDESQITGSASSYARKYALCGLFAIDDNKDADALHQSHLEQQQSQQQPAQEARQPQQPAQQQKPHYSDEQLNANAAQWRDDLANGKYNVGALLGTLSGQFTLTPQQVNTIRGLVPQQYQK